MRTVLWILLGALIMYILLRILSKSSTGASQTNTKLFALLRTQQIGNLIRTNEFRELIKTNEFKSFINTLASEQLAAMSGALVGTTIKPL
jgi:hypothetical protein